MKMSRVGKGRARCTMRGVAQAGSPASLLLCQTNRVLHVSRASRSSLFANSSPSADEFRFARSSLCIAWTGYTPSKGKRHETDAQVAGCCPILSPVSCTFCQTTDEAALVGVSVSTLRVMITRMFLFLSEPRQTCQASIQALLVPCIYAAWIRTNRIAKQIHGRTSCFRCISTVMMAVLSYVSGFLIVFGPT